MKGGRETKPDKIRFEKSQVSIVDRSGRVTFAQSEIPAWLAATIRRERRWAAENELLRHVVAPGRRELSVNASADAQKLGDVKIF